MVRSNTLRGALLLGGAALMAFVACANGPNPAPAPPEPTYGEATEPELPELAGTIEDVLVDRDGDITTVQLVGLADPIYTAFRQHAPDRLVVDLPGVAVGDIVDSMAIYDGLIEDVTLETLTAPGAEPRTRLEVTLATEVEYDVEGLGDRFELRVWQSEGASAGLAANDAAEAGYDADSVSDLASSGTTYGDSPEEMTFVGEGGGGFPASADPAQKLTGIEAAGQDSGTLVTLWADGEITDMTHFVIPDPTRLVVDLPGLTNGVSTSKIDVGTDAVARLRVGQHADKVRVVLDAAGDGQELEAASFVQTSKGLTLVIGDATPTHAAYWPWGGSRPSEHAAAGSQHATELSETPPTLTLEDEGLELATNELDEAVPAELAPDTEATDDASFDAFIAETSDETQPLLAEEPSTGALTEDANALVDDPAPAEEYADTVADELATPEEDAAAHRSGAGIHVYGVQFDGQSDRDRVVVLSDSQARYEVLEPDPSTLILQLAHADIDPEAAVRLAPEEPAAVSMVRAFQQPETEVPEVRIVIRRAPGVTPEITQQGTMLFLDFPHSAGMAADIPMLAAADRAAAVEPEVHHVADKAMAQNHAELMPEPVPAAIEPMEAIDILQEGGLIEGKAYTGRRVSLDFKDVEIADVLRLIAEVSDLNVIAGDEVQGQVTIRLVDVPWDQALDVILLTKGLGFVRVGNVLRIAPLDLLKAEEEARLQERRAKEKLEDLVVKLQPVNYAAVNEVSDMVKRLLSARGTVDIDKRTNTLILKDIPSVIDEATALVKAIDTQTPQVLIEAKIVEANLDFSREIGSTWAFGAQPLVDGFDADSGIRQDIGSEDLKFHNNPSLTGFTDTFNHVSVANPITSLANGLLDLGAFILDEKFNVELRLEAAESNGEGKVISSPRVVTLDNREATIEQGVSIPFQTFENGDAKLEFIDAVLKLEVTPHITADRSIIMDIEVQRNAPDDSVPTPTGSPAIAKNQAETETLVKDGQTLVIGGIYVVRKSDRESRVPYLHKIPLLGPAFRNTEIRDIRQELLVFVTPRIVVNPDAGS